MKKFFLIIALFCLIIPGYSQYVTKQEFQSELQKFKTTTGEYMTGWKLTFWVPNKARKFDIAIEKNFLVYMVDSLKYYYVTMAVRGDQSMSDVFTTGSYSSVPSTAFVATTGSFSGNISAAKLNTGFGDNELYDMNQNVQTTDSPTFANLLLSGTSGTLTATTVTTGSLSITAGTITGTAALRGHANFTNTENVVKVWVPGVTSNDYFFIQANQSDSTSTILATDNLTTFVKTDTLVVIRPANGTSGLSFDWIRIK